MTHNWYSQTDKTQSGCCSVVSFFKERSHDWSHDWEVVTAMVMEVITSNNPQMDFSFNLAVSWSTTEPSFSFNTADNDDNGHSDWVWFITSLPWELTEFSVSVFSSGSVGEEMTMLLTLDFWKWDVSEVSGRADEDKDEGLAVSEEVEGKDRILDTVIVVKVVSTGMTVAPVEESKLALGMTGDGDEERALLLLTLCIKSVNSCSLFFESVSLLSNFTFAVLWS